MKSNESRVKCGNWRLTESGYPAFYGRVFHIQVQFDNKSPDFELIFSSSLDEDAHNEAWGVSNFTATALIESIPTISTAHITQSFTVGVEPEGWMLTGNTNNLKVT